MTQSPETKTSKTFRLSNDTIDYIKSLSSFFGESQADTIERAIKLLNDNKVLAAKREYDQRIDQIKGK